MTPSCLIVPSVTLTFTPNSSNSLMWTNVSLIFPGTSGIRKTWKKTGSLTNLVSLHHNRWILKGRASANLNAFLLVSLVEFDRPLFCFGNREPLSMERVNVVFCLSCDFIFQPNNKNSVSTNKLQRKRPGNAPKSHSHLRRPRYHSHQEVTRVMIPEVLIVLILGQDGVDMVLPCWVGESGPADFSRTVKDQDHIRVK